MTDESAPQTQPAGPRWQPIGPIDRRVLGVLVEKAKTTPDAYPMSLNALVTGCNQKSNRHPLMQLAPEDVEESLERLRHLGAVGIVQGMGRVSKYRHYFYEWLGVDKVEAAVMAELLLRGAQTEGELRGHVSRMEPIADLTALRPVLESLKAKGLVVPLTPEGRGHVVAHALYSPRELEHLRIQYAGAAVAPEGNLQAMVPTDTSATAAPPSAAGSRGPTLAELSQAIDSLQTQVAELRHDVGRLSGDLDKARQEILRLRAELGETSP
ncbi:MAG: YceH family protein [Thermoguttaceae bacterium]|jgi:uncharacterized protein YceH (UPF0502 family)|nr:YceH family protein [Thermoguttaceae bacterium]